MHRWREPMGVQGLSARTTVSLVHGQVRPAGGSGVYAAPLAGPPRFPTLLNGVGSMPALAQ
jgi:hypothetical protein